MLQLLICFSLFFAAPVYAGNNWGNGGHSVVCRDAKDRIVRAQLLDLYEGQELF